MIQAICWVLIHSLWQGLLFTVITGLVMTVTRKASAACRYNCLTALLLVFLAICALTFFREWNSGGERSIGLSYAAPFAGIPISRFIETLNAWLSDHAPLIVMAWCLLFIAKCVRMTAALVYIQRVKNYRRTFASAYWKEKMTGFCDRLHIKKTVLLMESGVTRVPLVIGHLKPVIFIPLGLLTNLPEGEIEAVLLHELAHIRRNDYLVNFLQNIAENIFFFNPGLLWISSLLRQERENCCDDMAITQTGDKIQFVRALVSFKEHALVAPQLATAFPGNRNQLIRRAMRIVHNKNSTMNAAEKIFFGMSCLVAAALLFAASTKAPLIRQSSGQAVSALSPTAPISPPSVAAPMKGTRIPKQKRKITTMIYYSKTIVSDDREQAKGDADRAGQDAILAEKDAAQAKKDAIQAIQDAKQAERDRVQAEIDKQQAEKDHWQAEQDRRRPEKVKSSPEQHLP